MMAEEWQFVQIKKPKKGSNPSKFFSSNGRTDEKLSKNKFSPQHQLKYEQHGRRNSNSSSSETITILTSISTDLVISKIENAIDCLQQSSLFVSICAAIDSVSNEKFKSIICLGVGNFSTSPNCLLQMSLYISLRKKYLDHESMHKASSDVDTKNNFHTQSFIYDPMLTEIERSVCFQLGIPVCEENLHGQYLIPSNTTDEGADEKVLFFLPHCPYQLYCNLLWTNVSELQRMYILGNSFQSYMLRRLYYGGGGSGGESNPTEGSGDRSSDISLFAEYFNENELWNSFASGLSSQEKRRMVIKGCDTAASTTDFAALEAAFCDTSLMFPKSDGRVPYIIKHKPSPEQLKFATENDLEMI